MLLIITHKTDFTADFVINKLNKRNIRYKRFNCEDLPEYDYLINFKKDFKYSLLKESQFSSVWFRRTQLPDITNIASSDKIYLLNEYDSFINNLFAIIDAKWISDPFSVYKAENKLLQLKVAQKIGFNIPDTLVTNSKETLISFFEANDKNIIIKPLSQTRIDNSESPSFIFTNSVSQKQIDDLDNFDLTPCIFQKYIDKDFEIRVTVVGNNVFGAAVDSQEDEETKIDWRRKKLTFRSIELPQQVESLCIQITNELGLKFGAIDLIKNKTGDFVFLEINPNGQWVWIENQTNLPISDALISELINN